MRIPLSTAGSRDDVEPFLEPVPHQGVLPHCVAAIHHGGAGTEPLPARRLTADRLAARPAAMSSPTAAQRQAAENSRGQALTTIAG
ncbi:hypothetical protein [Kutzneria sp. CA-103260]|uniref:hypothetical protein n=1 Tax=Kutzneria sp. CA-103260 TaxID=2802641 RepID=UPI001BA52AD2|nr:hypothetical protein [Kutzneria sp. CA-103260]